MTDEERKLWECYRVGGKKRYVWRNAIAWTAAIAIPSIIVGAIHQGLGWHASDSWIDLIFQSAFIVALPLLANLAWMGVKYDRKESEYQKSENRTVIRVELTNGRS
jgi:hypothetical protein